MERTSITDWRIAPIDWVALVLLIIGGINWAFVGFFNFDLVKMLFGEMTVFSRIVYVLVGLSAIWCIASLAMHLHHRTYEAPGTVTH